MKFIYVGRTPFKTAREAVKEIIRLSGEDASIWQLSRALLTRRGRVNGIPVCKKTVDDPEVALAVEEAAEQNRISGRRAPLLRMKDYQGGIPPQWR
jgi:hypothetical protein